MLSVWILPENHDLASKRSAVVLGFSVSSFSNVKNLFFKQDFATSTVYTFEP